MSRPDRFAIAEGNDYRAMWEETARDALIWRKRYEELWDAVEAFIETMQRARSQLERVWRGEDDDAE